MGLNIDSERAERLARELADATRQSVTAAIEQALQEKLNNIAIEKDIQARRERVRAMLDSHGPVPPGLTSDHSDLYDEIGLPK